MALGGCSSHEPPQVVLAKQCRPISQAEPLSLSVRAPHEALLRISVEQQGISLVASVGGRQARSPIERYGSVTFVPRVRANEPVLLSVQSRDAPDIHGEVCVSAVELVPSDRPRQRAELAFAAAGESVQAGEFQRAFELYLQAARAFDGVDTYRTAQSRHAMAELANYRLGREGDAYVLATWALAEYGKDANAGLRSSLYSLLATSSSELPQYTPAARRARVLGLLDSAQRLAHAAPFGARELPRFEILRGFMEYAVGDTKSAAEHFNAAARQCEALSDWECYARASQNLAAAAEEARNVTTALSAYREALRVLPARFDPQLSADIWGNYGRLQGASGLFRESEQAHRESIRLYAQFDGCDGARVGLSRLGTLLVQVGSIGEGHSYLARAASQTCEQLLANARREFSEDALAEDDSAAAAARAEALNNTSCANPIPLETLGAQGRLAVFNALLGLRDAYRLEGQHSQANRCLASAQTYASTVRTRLRLANAEGSSLLEQGNTDGATRHFKRALATADRAALPETHENRSVAWLGLARAALIRKQPGAAREHAGRALHAGSARADVGQVVDSLQLLAQSFNGSTERDTAVSILRTAAGLIEQVPIDDMDAEKRATWLATQHAVFAELMTLFATGADDEMRSWEAFEVSERGRARSIRYAMNQAMTHEGAPPSSATYHELMQRISHLARPGADGDSAQAVMEDLAEIAGRGDPPRETVEPELLQQRLARLDATAVEYAAGRDDMFAFVIDRKHIRVTRLGTRQDIAAAAAALYERLRNPESAASDVRRAARKVAELVLWPIAGQITDRRVIFVPDDALHTVPFAVLPWTHAENSRLLIEQVELSVMPSTLFVTRERGGDAAHHSSRFELIGDPVFRASDWRRECEEDLSSTSDNATGVDRGLSDLRSLPRLPGSRKEVLAIEQLARLTSPSRQVRKHLGCAATPTALREGAASAPALLHIATHGYVDAYRPRLSALALSPDPNSPGGAASFGLLDILNMKIDARLVVLSACDTSRGRLLPGEGVLGPAQAFLQAGASTVIASYWRIADDSTAPFMQSFYRYLLVDRMTAAAALRRTQLDYARSNGSHEWAAFTLYGWPDTSL